MRLFVTSVLALTACRSAPSKPPITSTPPAIAKYPAPLYAGLFAKGARYTYSVDTSDSYWNPDTRQDEETKATTAMTCVVTEVQQLASSVAAAIECDGDSGLLFEDGPAGVFVASADGLWRAPDLASAAQFKPKEMLFTSPPAESSSLETFPNEPMWRIETTVSHYTDGTWCRTSDALVGDAMVDMVCVRDGVIVHGWKSSDGGSTHSATYRLTQGA